jgi:hypothetical protein
MGFVCFLALGCSAADPGVEGLTRGEFSEAGTSGDDATVKPSDAGGDAVVLPNDSGATDAPSDAIATQNAFSGDNNPYAANPPPTTAATFHTQNNVGITPGKNQDCLSCHKMGGTGPQFLFAGTIFKDMTGTTPAADIEVRVLGSDNKGFSAYSDTDGNFWYLPGQNDALAYPANHGARDTATTVLMSETATASSCNANGCHDGTTQAYLHIP